MTTPSSRGPLRRNLVLRSDGKTVNVVRKKGHLFVCATGCCCGHTDRGYAPVPVDLYHQEWERRKLRNRVHLTQGGCLGPCPLANVALLLFDGRSIFFHSLDTEQQILALFDYIDRMLEADAYLPPPPDLANYYFTGFTWEDRPDGQHLDDRRPARPRGLEVVPEGFLFLTHADTDLLALSKALRRLPPDFPPVRAANLSYLKTDQDVDAFLDAELPRAEVVILRLLGGRASFAHGLERLVRDAQVRDTWLLCLPGTDALDPELTALSNVGVPVAHEAFAYLQFGGPENVEQLLRFLSDHLLATGFGFDRPAEQPRHGVYLPGRGVATLEAWRAQCDPARPTVGILFYRSHLQSGNTDFVDALVAECDRQGLNALPVFAYSLKDNDDGDLPAALRYFLQDGRPIVDVLVTTMSFAMGTFVTDGPTPSGWSVEALTRLDVPVLQAINASMSRALWEASPRGLGPLDTAMNVAIPEFDGRIITVPISFKETVDPGRGSVCSHAAPDARAAQAMEPGAVPTLGAAETRCACGEDSAAASSGPTARALGCPVIQYMPDPERIARLVGLARRFAVLRRKPNAQKRVAFVLTNYNAKASRIANAVGLDSPASLIRVLRALKQAGYDVRDIPESGDALLQMLVDRCSYDLELLTEAQLRQAAARVPAEQYQEWFAALPAKNQREIEGRWGAPPGDAYVAAGRIAVAGLALGNAFVAIQPPRGYGLDPNLIYHMPDLPPTHHYTAFYRWLAAPPPEGWGADAIVHVGKHGTLEWLPGKGVGLSGTCYPDLFQADLPLIYPFIINDPGEGAQAKRRAHAVVVDHMTPPLTTADAYGQLDKLARLVDEYYQVEMLDPAKLPLIQQQIWELFTAARLDEDLKAMLKRQQALGDHTHPWDDELTEEGTPVTLAEMRGKDFAHLIENIDGYLCELAGLQIRNGLHTLGEVPQGEALVDLILALVRLPNLYVPSLRAAVAACFGADLEALLGDLGARLPTPLPTLEARAGRPLRSNADAVEEIDRAAKALVAALAGEGEGACLDGAQPPAPFAPAAIVPALRRLLPAAAPGEARRQVEQVLRFVCDELVPNLRRTEDEIGNLLRALDGRYVPAGPSGAPTRGMAHVLPTGRNFYAIDPRTLPSSAAWRVGEQLAAELLERYRRETGRYPESVGLSIWGTSAMRTHGDDIAQVLALLGVKPCWQPESRRLVGVEVVPLERLGRPRVDVVCRISGFFRDAFPHVIAVLDEAVRLVAELDEHPEDNFVRKRYLADLARQRAQGRSAEEARRRALYRVFGSKPGTYGAGILPLIDESNWSSVADFAEAYVNWGGYAYTADAAGVDARDEFRTVLGRVQVAAKNQDNREHDIFDSDDYLQFHGGMIATIRALSGKPPHRYFGDTSDPARARVRDLKEEALRVFRSRVVNPKWIQSITRHGYKGALELVATVDYLFGYDATADVVDDWMYDQLARTYVLDPAMQEFFRQSNPWALRDAAQRLVEAANRGLWERPDPETLRALRRTLLDAESSLEGRVEEVRRLP